MEELKIISIILVLGALAFVVFGMTMGKKARYDFDMLEAFVDDCDANFDNQATCVEEFARLKDGGLVATEEMDRLARKIVQKFK